ncbi:MAG: phenylalanine 4-monooxygenase [Armatimonadetes bacterium]|nr:phenylalanine 4-monooxygenase [Armatimonadota bacterium]
MAQLKEHRHPAGEGLTTTEAPFIEEAKSNGQLYIEQPYELYSEQNHQAWRDLYHRMVPLWDQYANDQFKQGISALCLDPNQVPRLSDVNKFLAPLTGFSAKAVSGYVPAFLFFDCIRQREFPTTITIRRYDKLDYLPEPDIFHDIAGHVPMHTDKRFADTLVRFGEVARTAAEIVQEIKGKREQTETLTSIMKAMARFFWFTIEFGLMKGKDGGVRAYGSGLLSSFGELQYSCTSPKAQRYPLQMEWVINQYFEIYHYQPLYFVAEDFEHVFEQVDLLEKWLKEGKLSNVQPGEPAINRHDLKSFLNASI